MKNKEVTNTVSLLLTINVYFYYFFNFMRNTIYF